MTNLLIASNILLWISVLTLTGVVFALLRQIGVLYERVAPAGALMMNKTLKVGDAGPAIDIQSLSSGNSLSIAGSRPAQRSQLLFFLDSKCPVCKTLLPALKSAAQAERSWLDIVLAGDSDEPTQKEFIKAHSLQDFEFANSDTLGRQYGVSKLPFAVLLDDKGMISSMGLINSREHLESLFEAKERGVASIQEYLQATRNA